MMEDAVTIEMQVPSEAILWQWFARACKLDVFRFIKAHMVVEKRTAKELGRHYSMPYGSLIYVYTDGDLADDITTILHELAHGVAGQHIQHGMLWRAAYAAAAQELTGEPIRVSLLSQEGMAMYWQDQSVKSAIERLLHKEGTQ